MPMPRVRFTVGRMMVATATIALLLGALAAVRDMQVRAAAYGALAIEHAHAEDQFGQAAARGADYLGLLRPRAEDRAREAKFIAQDEADYPRWDSERRVRQADRVATAAGQDVADVSVKVDQLSRRAAYHRGLKSKYEKAVRRPWRLAPPDPPVPAIPTHLP